MTAMIRRTSIGVALLLGAACASPGERGGAARQDIALPRQTDTVTAHVPKDATFESLLRNHELSSELTTALVSAIRGVFDPRSLRANQTYRLTRSLDGLFREFQYQIDADRLLRVVSKSDATSAPPQFEVEVVSLPKTVATDAVTADITRATPSLIAALDAKGQNVQLALQLADIFGGEVDFNGDLQPGDRIDVLFERMTRDGEFAGYGDIQAAVLINAGRRVSAIRYAGADGKPAWYDEDGRSLKRQFLRSPLLVDTRVTSRFSYNRLHPVHGVRRAHLGVDYGAATGTPVMAVAAGTVEVAGTVGEAGRMVEIRHAGGYETSYLHLSAFGPGIRPGARVDQGQMIGRVGQSGTATGPHLDYRIKKNGVYVNPLVELSRMPKGESLAAAALAAFAADRDRLLADLVGRVPPASRPDR